MSSELIQHGAAPTGPEPSRMAWRLIATAPRDGTEILACNITVQGGHRSVVWWDAEAEHPPWNWDTQEGIAFHEDAFTHWADLLPAPCDEPRHGGDAPAAPGRSPAGAVDEASSEVEAPASQDLKALQAENERLKDERDAANAMVRQMSDALINLTPGGPEFYVVSEGGRADAWGCVSYAKDFQSRLTTALAESERKRVEATSAGRMLIAAEDARRIAIAAFNSAWDEQPTPPTKKQVSAERAAVQGADIAHQRALRRALEAIRALATPNQETPNAQG